MANGFATAGGGGGAIFLRVVGEVGMNVTATLGNRTKSGVIDQSGVLMLRLPKLGVWQVKTEKGESVSTTDVNVFDYGITEFSAKFSQVFTAFKLYDFDDDENTTTPLVYDLTEHFPQSYGTLTEENFFIKSKTIRLSFSGENHSGDAATLTPISKSTTSLSVTRGLSKSISGTLGNWFGTNVFFTAPAELWYIGPQRLDYVP